MTQHTAPIVGFSGLSHLGIVSSISAASKGFFVIAFDPDEKLIQQLSSGSIPVHEPGLLELLQRVSEQIIFTSEIHRLMQCNLVYISRDIPTNTDNKSDTSVILDMLLHIQSHIAPTAHVVLLSQVHPGFTRQLSVTYPTLSLYYQVETLIFGRAVERATVPERLIIGCKNPAVPLPEVFHSFLSAFNAPILLMRLESAELAKISINFFLVSSVSTTNTLAEVCEAIGADWSEIVPALRLDKPI